MDEVQGDRTYSYRRVNVAAQEADPGSLLHTMRRLIAVRKRHPAFGRGDLTWLECGTPAVAAYTRATVDERLFIVQNLSAENGGVEPAGHAKWTPRDDGRGRQLDVELSPL
jgi:maltose alpha-D-glucosyltransferase/alpha-amylase